VAVRRTKKKKEPLVTGNGERGFAHPKSTSTGRSGDPRGWGIEYLAMTIRKKEQRQGTEKGMEKSSGRGGRTLQTVMVYGAPEGGKDHRQGKDRWGPEELKSHRGWRS